MARICVLWTREDSGDGLGWRTHLTGVLREVFFVFFLSLFWLFLISFGFDSGPDPIDEYDAFALNVAKSVTEDSKYWTKPICEVLLLQEIFNGIGNYLRWANCSCSLCDRRLFVVLCFRRSEILHEAGVTDPFSKTSKVFADLTEENCKENKV